MCIVSDKIKFCTCVDGSYEDLPHYWLLHRFNKLKDLEIMGMPVMPLDFLQPNYLLNAQTLGERLNENDAFDKIIEFKPSSFAVFNLSIETWKIFRVMKAENILCHMP